jgi:hypothetical protein
VVIIHFVSHIGARSGKRDFVLAHFGDSTQHIVNWVEVGLNEVGVGIGGLHFLPSLTGDLSGDFFVKLLNLGGEPADFSQ